ncbi:hypothetical protein BLOT_007536, partial [Blomia tropicalis]
MEVDIDRVLLPSFFTTHDFNLSTLSPNLLCLDKLLLQVELNTLLNDHHTYLYRFISKYVT